MNKFISQEKWKPADGMVLEPAAELAVKSDNHTAVMAGPGAGKTELLAQRACYLLETGICKPPQKILAISFKVDAADNLAKRVEKRCGKELALRFESRTFDSFAKQLVDRFLLAINEDYRPSRDYNVVFNVNEIKDIAVGFLTESHPTHPNWQYEVNFNTLFEKLTYSPLPIKEEEGLYQWLVYKLWILLVRGKNTLHSTLSFPMISRLAEFLLRTNPFITNSLRATYSHIFLDEFQDTTLIQYDLLKTAFKGSEAILTAVGDDKQRIMGWAGALPNAFLQFKQDFSSSEIHLVLNHRSAPKLVEIQNILAKIIRHGSVEVSSSDKWKHEDGICKVWTFSNHIEEAKYIAKTLEELVRVRKISPRDLCVLVKQQEQVYAKALMIELEKLGVQARVEKDFQDLLSEECIQLAIDFLTLAIFQQFPESWQRVVNFLVDIEGIEQIGNGDKLLILENRLRNFIVELNSKLTQIQAEKEGCTKEVLKLFQIIFEFVGVDKILGAFPKYARGKYFGQLIKKGSEKLAESYKKSGCWKETIHDFLGYNSIPIMTIHKSKGLEYDTVIFLGLEDDAFWSFKTQTDADLCAFFVALSRAKRQIIFTFSASREVQKYRKLQIVQQTSINISSLYKMLSQAGVERFSISGSKV